MKLTTISVFLLACLSLKAAVETQYLQGLTSPVQANIDSRVLDTGDTMTGNLRWSGTTIPGLVPNNLTAIQIGNLVAPPVASTVFNTTSGKLNMWDGAVWNELRIGTYVRTTGDTMTGPLVIQGGAVVASTPVLDLSQTWNNGAVTFTGLKFNITDSASASASLFFDWQVGGVSKASVRKDGLIKAAFLESSGVYFGTLADTILVRGGVGTLDLRNLSNAQTFQVYGTADAGLLNYRRIRTTMTTGGAATIAAEGLGTGVSGNSLAFAVGSSASPTTVLSFGSSGTSATLNTGIVLYFGGSSSGISAPSDGIFKLSNNAGTGFSRLNFGGDTSSFPALRRTTTNIEAVLADNSDWAGVQSRYHRISSGSPEGVVTAPVGCLFSRIDGGAGTTLYVKESGSGNTGWVAK